ncbi:tetratricopeptide repeat protein [uncultured Parabacteroides sp.]|uniref:tetratricopeptide repeat protein n=1 Tax=uncultured Parabacteroides sp. TaxID=512312 RepID=UPI0026659E4A|nr:tetratricopeptide repeat protein [uncultured Parabacteroides sp.]
MKKLLLHITSLVSIVLFLFMSACNNHPQAPMLLEAEKIIEEQPDSALSILNKIENVNQLSEKDHATYCLLLTQAQDLNYITHTSDSLIKIAATYFEKNKDKPRSMLAYYYLGRVNSDLQDALQAQEYYLKALEIGDDSKDYHLLARIYNNLGTLYSYQGIYEMALPMHQKALHFLEQESKRDTVNISYVLRNTARIFTLMNLEDSAIIYHNKALKYSIPYNISSILVDLGNIFIIKGDYDKAKNYLDQAQNLTTIPKTLCPIYLSKGELFTAINQIDSAKFYLTKCSQSPNIYTQAGGLHHLAQVALIENNLSDYVKYTEAYSILRDSITNRSHFENIRIAQSMFNYHCIAKEKDIFEKKATQRMILIYQVIIIFSITIAIFIFIFKREKIKKKQLTDLKEEQYKRSQQYIEDNEKQISQLTEMFHTKQKEMSEVEKQLYEARKLMLEMENRQIFEKQGTIQLLEKDFHNSSLYIRIHREDDIQLSPSEWEELHQLIDATYPDFTNRLIKLYTQISIEEIHICYLVKMQLPIKKIAFIMHITSSGVSQCRRRLYKKFTGEPQNTEKFDKFITDF